MGTITQTTAPADTETASDFGSQLQYSLTTVPDPLTISPPNGTVEEADLIIVGSRIHPDPIETNEISVYVHAGTEAWQLVLDHTGLQPSITLPDWTATVDSAEGRILFKPNTGTATLSPEQGVTLHLNKLRINRQVGTSPVTIELKWRAPGSSSWRTETQDLAVGKFPAGFYLRNLKADAAYIENGDPVTLTWERSEGATYHLLYDNVEIDVTKYSTYTVQDIRRNTMFYLRGRVQQGTGTAERTLSTYVTVNRPDLEVRNLDVHGKTGVMSRRTMSAPDDTRDWEATAQTDGLLNAQVIRGKLMVRHQNDSTGNSWSTGFTAGDGDGATLLIPVEKGWKVKISWLGSVGHATMFWFAFGDGDLTYD
ncbi:hypothetical protein [Streptomyces noursei]|uniref:hypothetical protein n=1 Tax=Streptomyces noursei TaxID=1971 RepID=UPI0005CAC529|nr:hypothetical protein [Streptomyces noursei]